MSLFELDDGRLVPAQFGRVVEGAMAPEVLAAVRSQVLEIVSRPLLPIAWSTVVRPRSDVAEQFRLTALDASGQVVSVEVVDLLDSDLLIDSLSQLSDTASLSWVDLAQQHAGGVEGFKSSWAQFRQSMPPSLPNGPRLVIVAAAISPDVRPALDLLSASGVEVHELSLRQMSNGRTFLDVALVGPRMYGHRANLLETASLPQLPAVAVHSAPTSAAPAVAPPKKTRHASVESPRRAHVARTPPADPSPRTFPSRRPARTSTGAIPVLEHQVDPGPEALALVAQVLQVDTPLSLAPATRTPPGATLSAAGKIIVPTGSFDDPTLALEAGGIVGEDGWISWHLGDQYGPTLGEALEEINRDASH